MDEDALRKYALKVWKYKEGEFVSLMIHIGDRLGLYQAMADLGPVSSQDLASATGLHERWVREWLLGQAAAGLIHKVDETFELDELGKTVLADEGSSVFFAAGAFTSLSGMDLADNVAEAFRTGLGFTYEEQGQSRTLMTQRMTRASFDKLLIPEVIPLVDGLREKLERGAQVADVGCGSGSAVVALAKAFPNSRFTGYDPSPTAIAVAVEAGADLDNATFHEVGGESLPADVRLDLVLALDCLHDMPRPDLALAAISNALADDGTLLIKDIKSSPDFEANRRNPVLALQYGYSLTSCLPSGMSSEDGLGLGTLGFNPQVAEAMCAAAGLTSFKTHDIGDPTNLYHEVRR